MNHWKQVLFERLRGKGVEESEIPGLVRTLANTCLLDSDVSLQRVNKRLSYLGWVDFELDYLTLQLMISCFENETLGKYAFRPVSRF